MRVIDRSIDRKGKRRMVLNSYIHETRKIRAIRLISQQKWRIDVNESVCLKI